MAIKKSWLPARLADLAAMFSNIKAKITGYTPVLPLTPAQEAKIILICNTFLAAYEYAEQVRASAEATVEWRNDILRGEPVGAAAADPPTFPTAAMPVGAFIGILVAFRELRELIVALPGYTPSIGEDLMIVAPDTPSAPEEEVTPVLKVTTASGYKIKIAGSMQQMDGLRVEYQRNGSPSWSIAAFMTKLPGEFIVTPQTPGEPENGRVRAIFLQKNVAYGEYSPEYPVTVA